MGDTDPFSDTAGMGRRITEGEFKLLQPVFRDTLPYSRILCYTMAGGISITPTGNPYFARAIYFDDFSNIPDSVGSNKKAAAQWTFVHELTHVWQYYHGINVLRKAICVANLPGPYAEAYKYHLAKRQPFLSYNIEQQAAIVADYWGWTRKIPLYYNQDETPQLSHYDEAIKTVQQSGYPRLPVFPTAPEFPNSDAN
jgi:hypothetical protein